MRELKHEHPAPVVALFDIGGRLEEFCGFLDIQRDSLARYPHRLLIWVNPHERNVLAAHAPNFVLRLSGVFYFPDTESATAVSVAANGLRAQSTTILSSSTRRRAYVAIKGGQMRSALVDYYLQRIKESALCRDHILISSATPGMTWPGSYATDAPGRLGEAEAAYAEAARTYAHAGNSLAEAEARYQAGLASSAFYALEAAQDHLHAALSLYALLADSPSRTQDAIMGEANVLKAQGDVLYFLKETQAALAKYEAALGLFRAVGDRLGEANVLKAQGDVLAFMDERQAALAKYEAALGLFRAVGYRLGEANVLKAQGDVLAFMDERQAALAKL